MRHYLGILVCALSGGTAANGQVVFDNFGPNGEYQFNRGWAIAGNGVFLGELDQGFGFVPAVGGPVDSIEVAMAHSEGVNEFELWVFDSFGGAPANLIWGSGPIIDAMGHFGLVNPPVFVDVGGAFSVSAGEQYFIAASVPDGAFAAWCQNSIRDVGTKILRRSGGWTITNSVRPAARVTLDVGPVCDPVLITTQPTDALVCAGHDALFTVGVAGTGPFAFQWRFQGQPIQGATSQELLLSPADFDDIGSYDVIVTNDCGVDTSAAAILGVGPSGPEIIAHPGSLELCPGALASFSVSAAPHMGGGLSYQWMFNGDPIPGATGSTYEFVVAGDSQEGAYSVEVCEADCGCTDSFPALLTVRDDPPVITLNGPMEIGLECGVDPYYELGATAADDCDANVPVIVGGDVVNPHMPGLYIVTYDAIDSQGHAAETVRRYVSVADITPPTVDVAVFEPVLWSPQHEMVNVGLVATISDDCDPTAANNRIVRVYSDEVELPDTGDGTGKHSPDAKDIDLGSLRLRSERQGRGDGRIYLIIVSVMDASGNVGFGIQTVVCPHAEDQAALDLALAQAAAIRHLAGTVASTATDLDFVERAVLDAGYMLHGVAPENGPHQ